MELWCSRGRGDDVVKQQKKGKQRIRFDDMGLNPPCLISGRVIFFSSEPHLSSREIQKEWDYFHESSPKNKTYMSI